MSNKSKSKVKSYARRTKKGVSRVKESIRSKPKRKMSIGKKLAVAGGVGLSLAGLGLAGKKLTKEVARQKNIRNFKPEMDGPIVRIGNRNKSLLDDSAISLSWAKQTKKRNNTKKVKERKELLKTHTAGKIDTGGGPSSYMNAIQLSWYGNEKIRKQSAKLLAETARDLRAKGMYS